MPFDGEAVGERDAAPGGVARVAPVAGLQQYRMKHSEFGHLAADAVDLDPVSQANAVSAHQHQPAEEGHDEVLQRHRQPGAHDPDHGPELAGHADENEQDDDRGDHSQTDPREAAKGFDLPAVQLEVIEQTLGPFIDEQNYQQNADHDRRVEQQPVQYGARLQRDHSDPLLINARQLPEVGGLAVQQRQHLLIGGGEPSAAPPPPPGLSGAPP